MRKDSEKFKHISKFVSALAWLAVAALAALCPSEAEGQTPARKSNLPAIYISTFNNADITSKTQYIYCTLSYVDEQDSVAQYDSVSIRGRGNSTWNMAKKPYRIKFPGKEKFLGKGYANAKKWTLLANAGDKTMIRNALTSFMGNWLGLEFNPAFRFVDLTLNDTYLGTYQISDQIEVRKKRVNVEEQEYPLTDSTDISGGYLLEADGFWDGNCFGTSKRNVPVRIHYPDEEEIAQAQNTYIKNYVNSFEEALFGSDYADAEKGYRPMVDSISLIDWYIATEVSANIDGFYSTYFYKRAQDARLYWGPLWDYDIAYGNDSRKGDTSQQLMADVGYGSVRDWVCRMWEDPWFAQKVNARYKEAVDAGLDDALYACIDSLTALLAESQELNYEKWGINRRMYNERVLYSSYDQYVSDLKKYIAVHVPYLSTAFASRQPEEQTKAFTAQNFYYRIVNAGTHTVFDVEDSSTEAGALTCAWSNSATRTSEEWIIKPVGEYFHITNRNGGMALNDPTEGEVGPTVNIGKRINVAEPDTLDDRQLWTLQPQGTGGTYNLINKHSQHTINLANGNNADGTPLLSYTTSDKNATSNNRKWYLNAGDSIETPSTPSAINDIEPDGYALAYNASSEILHFGADRPELLTFSVSVYSAGGQRVATFKAGDGCNVSHLPKGVYIVSWTVGGKTRSAKFVKAGSIN